MFIFHADRSIPLKSVNRLKSKLSKAGISVMAYAVTPYTQLYDSKYYRNRLIQLRIPPHFPPEMKPKPIPHDSTLQSRIHLTALSSRQFIINNDTIDKDNFITHFRQELSISSETVFVIHQHKIKTVGAFVSLYSLYTQAILALRNDLAREKYDLPYDSLDGTKPQIIQDEIPIRLIFR